MSESLSLPQRSTDQSWIVSKFGGTSVASIDRWQQIAKVMRQHIATGFRVILVCSAPAKVSDLLEKLLQEAVNNNYSETLTAIQQRYLTLAEELGVDYSAILKNDMEALTQLITGISLVAEITPRVCAKVMSYGELMLTRLGAAYLQQNQIDVCWQNATELLTTVKPLPGHQNQRYLAERCSEDYNAELEHRLITLNAKVIITQGFIAGNEKQEPVLLGRGGSDTSAAYFAAQVNAQHCEIWTDVLGIYTANPHQIPEARLLKHLDYDEAQEIASMGAKVLHPNCIDPVKKHHIPLHIKETSHPEREGTIISLRSDQFGLQIKSIITRLNILIITIETVYMWKRVGFLADVFVCFKRHGFSVDFISTSESNITVSLDNNIYRNNADSLQTLLDDLNTFAKASIIGPCASISLIGKNIRMIVPQLGEAFEAFEAQQIHLFSQAANDLNLTFVVDEEQVERLCKKLHYLLIEKNPKSYILGPTWQEGYGQVEAQPAFWWQRLRENLLQIAHEQLPRYVYDKHTLCSAIQELKSCQAVDQIFYAMKANFNKDILNEIIQAGLGVECVSLDEINYVLKLFPTIHRSRILFTPNFAPKQEYQEALELDVHVTLDNLYILQQWGELFSQRSILLRIDPGYGRGHHKYVHTGGNDSKFGIPIAYLNQVVELTQQHDIHVVGLHAHTGSGILQADNWYNTAVQLTGLLKHFPDVQVLNLGGGLGIVEKPGQKPLGIQQLDASLKQIKTVFPQLKIWLEPGRFLVARAGVLLARVTQIKTKDNMKFVGIETGMNSLIRPALYGAYHEIVNLSKLGEPNAEVVTIVGPICESGDTLGYSRLLPETVEGDILLIANTGAYGYCMSSHYNLREPAAEYFLDDKSFSLHQKQQKSGKVEI